MEAAPEGEARSDPDDHLVTGRPALVAVAEQDEPLADAPRRGVRRGAGRFLRDRVEREVADQPDAL
ncbi:MAG TPA: hypothetical protein VG370_24000 [Chloroflexota bacterium]|nr:hypothetical protein [Chloroflexota bacterium]